MINLKNRSIALKNYIKGMPEASDFDFLEKELPTLKDNQVLLKTIYISLDPYMRGLMSGHKSYRDPAEIGVPIPAGTIGQVLDSKSDSFKKGDFALGNGGWQTHWCEQENKLRKIDSNLAPLTYYLGVLGMPGHTAYSGIVGLSELKPGETLIVSAATGAVGSIVGQIAKIKGAKVFGIAGSKEKCKYAIEDLGFDDCFNHKENIKEDLKKYCAEGIDINFENVGGEIFWDIFKHMNFHGRIILCGFISQYNQINKPSNTSDKSLNLLSSLVIKRLKINGLLVYDWKHNYSQFQEEVIGWLKQGRIKYKVDVVNGFENTIKEFQGLLRGKNFGKLIIRVDEDPTL